MHIRNCCFVVLTSLLLAPFAVAQGKRPMTLVELLEVPQLSEPQLSPDGRQLLYQLGEADWEANKRVSHVWRIDADGSGQVQLTNGEGGEESPRWSPDGSRIAFLAERGDIEGTQIYLINNDVGEALALTDHRASVSNIAWSPDGRSIYFIAEEPLTEEEKQKKEVLDDVFAYDEDYKQRHLWKVSVEGGAEERITEGDFSIIGYQLSRDGRRIAHHRAPTPLIGDGDQGEVWVMNADGTGAVQLTDNKVPEQGAELSPDNTQVLFISDSNEAFTYYYNGNLFLVPSSGGKHRLMLKEMPHEVDEAHWSEDGKSIFFLANMGVHGELFEVDVATERLEQLTDGEHSIKNWSYSPELALQIFSIDEPTNAGDVWSLSTQTPGKPTRITKVYDFLDRDYLLPRQQAVQWKGEDGVTVEGLVYFPLDYQEGTHYPLIVQTHGGPRSSDKFEFGSWSRYVQVQTAMGYVVLKPNYRGSTGYGDEFLRNMVGHYYDQSHLDVMGGVDHLIEMGIADGDRMAKMGWSGGGHMTNKIITFTDRFKAASSGAGAVNWVSMYGQSDTRTQRTSWFGGTPWEENAPIDVYWDHSPLKDIWKVKTPTIILVGENDVRVPAPQSVELLRALKHNGVPSHLYMAPREPHGWRELRHELFKMNVELDWFEKYVTERDYTWAKAPEKNTEKAREPMN